MNHSSAWETPPASSLRNRQAGMFEVRQFDDALLTLLLLLKPWWRTRLIGNRREVRRSCRAETGTGKVIERLS